jgi:hypothetical protein
MERAGSRLPLEAGLAALSALLFIATGLWRDWIEIVFRIDPDRGDGTLEWLIMTVTAVSAILAALLARSEWRRLHETGGLTR